MKQFLFAYFPYTYSIQNLQLVNGFITAEARQVGICFKITAIDLF